MEDDVPPFTIVFVQLPLPLPTMFALLLPVLSPGLLRYKVPKKTDNQSVRVGVYLDAIICNSISFAQPTLHIFRFFLMSAL